MILLDTNVLSALMQKEPEPTVVSWLDRQPPESVWTTSITVFEIAFGLQLLVDGRRRRQLEEAFARALEEDLQGRVIAFDEPAASAAAILAAGQRRAGRSLDFRDLQIAGIAAARKATVATRNVRHFDGLGLSLVNPWTDDL